MTQPDAQAAESGVEARLRKHGKISTVMIPARDPARSAAFYARVFGWKTRSEGDHHAFDDGDLIGHWVPGDPAPDSGLILYMYCDRIDETLSRIRAEGCEIVRDVYPEGSLWVATFRDPAGNLMGVWQAGPR